MKECSGKLVEKFPGELEVGDVLIHSSNAYPIKHIIQDTGSVMYYVYMDDGGNEKVTQLYQSYKVTCFIPDPPKTVFEVRSQTEYYNVEERLISYYPTHIQDKILKKNIVDLHNIFMTKDAALMRARALWQDRLIELENKYKTWYNNTVKFIPYKEKK